MKPRGGQPADKCMGTHRSLQLLPHAIEVIMLAMAQDTLETTQA